MKSRRLTNGQKLGPYLITDLLGGGGMGEVYLAHDSTLDRSIALKILTADDPKSCERFLLEGKALARIAHPNVVAVYGVGQIDGIYFIAMEYVSGHTLDWCLKRGRLSLADQISVFRQICEGIAEAHQNLIIHRDLKPANVLVTPSGQAKLVDFGIAKVVSDDANNRTTVGVIMGTMNYLAPEIARGQSPSVQTDVYGLGAILFEMLTGTPPVVADNMLMALDKIKSEPAVVPQEIRALIPETLVNLVLRMLEKDLSARFGSVVDVLAEIRNVNLDELPAELRNSRAADIEIHNEKEVRSHLLNYGYGTREVSLIYGLACEIAERESMTSPADVDPDKTVEISIEPQAITMRIETVERARARYEQLKSQLMTARQNAQATPQAITSDRVAPVAPIAISENKTKQLPKRYFYTVGAALSALAVLGYLLLPQEFTSEAPNSLQVSTEQIEQPSVAAENSVAPSPPQRPAQSVEKRTPATQPNLPPPRAPETEDERARAEIDEQMRKRGEELRNVALKRQLFQSGDEWIYSRMDDPQAPATKYEIESDDGETLRFALNGQSKSSGFYGVKGLEALFPLRLGNRIEVELDGHKGNCQSFATGGPEKMRYKTPAGTFEIATIICKSEDDFATDTIYYSDVVGRQIFHLSKRGDQTQILTLQSYKRSNH